ncbi:hypothetical protein [Streptomyces sp. NPDC055287]
MRHSLLRCFFSRAFGAKMLLLRAERPASALAFSRASGVTA